jgi:hypothetical protein
MILQEPIDDIQMICLKLRRFLRDGNDTQPGLLAIKEAIDTWEPAPYDPNWEPEAPARWEPPPPLRTSRVTAEPLLWEADDPLLRPKAWLR